MRQDWDERAKNYRLYIGLTDSEEEFEESGERELEVILSDIRERLSPDASVLEIGCGAGRLLKPLAQRFRTVYGVDISPEMIRRAKERLKDCKNVEVWINNGSDLKPLPSDSIDFAFSYVVFQHIPEAAVIASYIHEAYRVLKPGGLFKFQVWGLEDTPEAEAAERARPKDTINGVRLTERQIRTMTEGAGFRILSTYVTENPILPLLWTIAEKPGRPAS